MSRDIVMGLAVLLFEVFIHIHQSRLERTPTSTALRLAFPLSGLVALSLWSLTALPLLSLGAGLIVTALIRLTMHRKKTAWWILSLPGRILLFYVATYTFFILTPPLTLLWMSLSVSSVFVLVTVLYAHNQLSKRFNLVPYHHTLEADDLSLWRDRLYLIQNKRIRLPMNALLFGYGKHAKIFFSPLLLGRLKSAHIEGIVAHEMGHQKQHHLGKRSLFLVLYVILVMAYGYHTLSASSPEVSDFANFTGGFIALTYLFKYGLIQLLHYQEYQADRFAIHYGAQTSLICALETIDRFYPSRKLSPWFVKTQQTHPLTHARIDRLKTKGIV